MFAEEAGCDDRWFPEWKELLGLRADLRREPFHSSCLVTLSTAYHPGVLERWWEVCARVDPEAARGGRDHPLRFSDQGALNALLMSEVEPGAVAEPPDMLLIYQGDQKFDCTEIVDVTRLECRDRGRAVTILSHDQAPKVWDAGGRARINRPDPYVRLLPRVLFGDDVELRLRPEDVPWWLRPGLRGLPARSAVYLGHARNRVAIRTRLAGRGRIRGR
jgi:hypothetical protein